MASRSASFNNHSLELTDINNEDTPDAFTSFYICTFLFPMLLTDTPFSVSGGLDLGCDLFKGVPGCWESISMLFMSHSFCLLFNLLVHI